MNKNLILLAIPVTLFLSEYRAKGSEFTDALSNYCVPTNSQYCTGPYAATYDVSKNVCSCKNSDYLRYNATDRHCEINCPAGSVPSVISSCPAGSISFLVAE